MDGRLRRRQCQRPFIGIRRVVVAPPRSEPPPTSPPPGPAPALVELRSEELLLQLGERSWRVRGLQRTTTFDSLRLNMLVRPQTRIARQPRATPSTPITSATRTSPTPRPESVCVPLLLAAFDV